MNDRMIRTIQPGLRITWIIQTPGFGLTSVNLSGPVTFLRETRRSVSEGAAQKTGARKNNKKKPQLTQRLEEARDQTNNFGLKGKAVPPFPDSGPIIKPNESTVVHFLIVRDLLFPPPFK